MIIFTDAATSAKNNVAVGAYLCVSQQLIDEYTQKDSKILTAKLAASIVYKKYQSKKSTWSEIKTTIIALHTILQKSGSGLNVEIYTDCQSLCDLLNRRKESLEKNNFVTRSGKTLTNADLYKELFTFTEIFKIKVIKIKGHMRNTQRLTVYEKIFALLDQMSRQKLRALLNKSS